MSWGKPDTQDISEGVFKVFIIMRSGFKLMIGFSNILFIASEITTSMVPNSDVHTEMEWNQHPKMRAPLSLPEVSLPFYWDASICLKVSGIEKFLCVHMNHLTFMPKC